MNPEFVKAQAIKAADKVRSGGIYTASRDLLGSHDFTVELRKALQGTQIIYAPVVGVGGGHAMDIIAK